MAGRKENTYTDEQVTQIEEMALHQCRDNTIAVALGLDIKTFQKHFSKKCAQKRAEGKAEKLKQQYQDKSPTMLVWWGKQHLGQKDKSENEIKSDVLMELIKQIGGSNSGIPVKERSK